MAHLYKLLSDKVLEWQTQDYKSDFPVISEILDYAKISDSTDLRFLRAAQLKALEVYWYLRLIEKTPKVFSLYQNYFPARSQRFEALGIDRTKQEIRDILDDYSEEHLL